MAALSPPRVLIVEDDAAGLQLVWLTLARAGYALDAADSAGGALALARGTGYAAILIDLALGDLDGAVLATQLRADPAVAAAPLVDMSAYALPEIESRARQAGFVRHLTKPLDFSALPGVVREVMAAGSA